MNQSRFDPLALLRLLVKHEVRFVLIGGYAGAVLGAPLVTNDLDICYERGAENLERLVAALRDATATLRVAKVEEDLPFLLDAKTLAAGDSFTFSTQFGDLDVLGTPSGTAGYRDLKARAVSTPIGDDLDVDVVDLGDLMRMKKAAGRTKDRLQLEVLASLAEELERRGG